MAVLEAIKIGKPILLFSLLEYLNQSFADIKDLD
jgi:hypothetical protein